jgi:hypothetical protein
VRYIYLSSVQFRGNHETAGGLVLKFVPNNTNNSSEGLVVVVAGLQQLLLRSD